MRWSGSRAVTVPRFSYCPSATVPVAVQVMDSFGAREVFGQLTITPASLSVTWISVSGSVPCR